MLDGEIDAVERTDGDPMACVGADTAGRVAAHAAAGDHRHGAPLQRAAARVVDGEADGDVLEVHRNHGRPHSQSTMRLRKREKNKSDTTTPAAVTANTTVQTKSDGALPSNGARMISTR